MATSGRAGLASARSSASSSATSSGPAQAMRRELGHAVGAGLGPMRRAEGIHHEHIAQRRHLPRQRLIVLLLALVEAHVLAQHHRAGRALDAAEPVLAQRHRLAEQLGELRGHRRQRELGLELALLAAGPGATARSRARPAAWPSASVGSAARMRASLLTTPSCTGTFRSSRISTRLPARSRSAMRSSFIALRTYAARDQASVVSSMRLEKPHSLSYQAHTLTSVPPMTLVMVAS